MKNKPIAQGAEAKVYLEVQNNYSKNPVISKQRIPKAYRHKQLDQQIRKQRTKREAKILNKALSLKINVPKVLNLNQKGEASDKFDLIIEYLKGDKLAETLNDYKESKQKEVMEKLGKQVSLIHENDIIHGDLTTSNVILKEEVYLIDFGLGFISTKIEDKAVDLHLIKQALEAKHWKNWEDLFKEFLKGYNWKESKQVVERLEVVEKRGRYKH